MLVLLVYLSGFVISVMMVWFFSWAVHRSLMHRLIRSPLTARVVSILPAWFIVATIIVLLDRGRSAPGTYLMSGIFALGYLPFAIVTGLRMRRALGAAHVDLVDTFS